MRLVFAVSLVSSLVPLGVSTARAEERVELNAVGDISWPSIGFALDVVDAKGPELFALTRPYLATGDLNFANLECPFTARPTQLRKTYSYACDPKRLDYVVAGGFNLLSLSNNHALDAGDEGVADTRAALAAASTETRPLFYAGSGTSAEDAGEPARFTVPGKSARVAFFAVSNAPPTSVVASLASPGLTERVAAAARDADIVIVSVHNGPEYVHVPTATAVARYHALIDAGADVVLGHHPHVIQGVERYKGGVIFYSLGNFSFASHTLRHKETGARLYSMIGRIVLVDGAVRDVSVVPLYVNNMEAWTLGGRTLEPLHCTPQPLDGEFAGAVLAELQDFSAAVPGASPTRIDRAGDLGVVERSDRALRVQNPGALARPQPARGTRGAHGRGRHHRGR